MEKNRDILLMEEILHQLRLVVFPLFTRFYTSEVVQDFFHQQYDIFPQFFQKRLGAYEDVVKSIIMMTCNFCLEQIIPNVCMASSNMCVWILHCILKFVCTVDCGPIQYHLVFSNPSKNCINHPQLFCIVGWPISQETGTC